MRYYTLCQFTPSRSTYRGAKHARIFANNPEGFLFHDTENSLEVEHIRKALYRLADIHQHDESGTIADTALVVRVNDNTLVATFSMTGLPRPVKYNTGYWQDSKIIEWLSESNLKGWYITSVKDSGVPATEINYSGLYDHCENLMRLMGNCPCELQRTGDCARQLVWSKMPEPFQDPVVQRSSYSLDSALLRRVKYKEIDGFHLVSGSHTTNADFNGGVRPWDNHDFGLVEGRKHELSTRGKTRHVRESTKKAICTPCAFSVRSYKGNVSDCGQLNRCTQGIGEADAWDTLFYWLDHQSGFMTMPGFTEEQRQYLIRLSGTIVTVRVLYESRQTKTKFAGFMRDIDGQWAYFLSAGAGQLNVKKAFKSYAELQAALNANSPVLGDAPELYKPLSRKLLLACATLGEHRRVTQAYQGFHPVCSVVAHTSETGDRETYVGLSASSGNYNNITWHLYENSAIANFVDKHSTFDYSDMAAKHLHMRTEVANNKLRLPVITE